MSRLTLSAFKVAKTIHLIYIPGLGDGYDPIRKLGLAFWNRKDVIVIHVPMNWSHETETFENKFARIERAVESNANHVVLVGESAGGAMAIAAAQLLGARIAHTITLCGMNQGVQNVNPRLYQSNPAFEATMQHADESGSKLTSEDKAAMTIVYSSNDFTVRPKNTLLSGVKAIDLKTPGHAFTILSVLYFRSGLIRKIAKQ